jgi:signal transduction histidine kinase
MSRKNDEINKLIHDIKSPLTSVIGYSELLLRKSPAGKEGEWILKLHEDALRIKDMMQKLSDTVAESPDRTD